MNIYKITFLLVSLGLSGNAISGAIDTTKITTYTSGSVISASEANAAITEIITQINDNNTRIAALEGPTDYTDILTRINGTYIGVYKSQEAIANGLTNFYTHASSGTVSASFTNGVGTLSVSGTHQLLDLKPLYSAAAATSVVDAEAGSPNVTLSVNSTGLITTVLEGRATSGSVNKKGDFITLISKDTTKEGQIIMILHKQ